MRCWRRSSALPPAASVRLPLRQADARGQLRPLMRQADRRIDWTRDDTATVVAKVNAADGFPGVADELFGVSCNLFDVHAEGQRPDGAPGDIVARRDGALLRLTRDGALWIGHVKRADREGAFKLPATIAFADQAAGLPESPAALMRDDVDRGANCAIARKARSATSPSSSTTARC